MAVASRLALVAVLLAIACRREPVPPPAPAPAPASAPAPDVRAAAAAAVPDAAPIARPPGEALALLYSSNLRGEYEAHPLGGLPRRVSYTARTRLEVGRLLQVDAGDSLLPRLHPVAGDPPPDPREVDRRARLVAGGLGRLKLDAFAPGETDLAMGAARLKALARQAGLPLVSANVVDGKGKPLFPAHRQLDLGGVRVGVFGILTLAPEDATAARAAGYATSDPVAAAQGTASLLREQGAQIVVGLYHLAGGLAEARKLGAEVAGVDVMVLGHRGDTLADPVVVGGGDEGASVAVEAGDQGRFLGRLDLHVVDGDPGFQVAGARQQTASGSWLGNRIVRLDTSVVSDEAMRAFIKPHIAENRRRAQRKLPVGLTAQAGTDGVLAEGAKENWTFASSAACALCHKPQTEQWRTTAHAYAMVTLENKGRERDPACLRCHSVGFDQPGGTRNLQTAVAYFGDVGCESCHGPSVKHIRTQDKTGTTRAVPEAVCTRCHRPEQSPRPFDYARDLKAILGPGHGT
jgi:2',3'-cyclic-nucleotide 2'-phosphodiesterase (5'-nucleotidase family)